MTDQTRSVRLLEIDPARLSTACSICWYAATSCSSCCKRRALASASGPPPALCDLFPQLVFLFGASQDRFHMRDLVVDAGEALLLQIIELLL